jgi:Flp pilus assembly protein TadD
MKTLSSKREEMREMSTSNYLHESREDAWVWDQIGDAYWREERRDAARRAWERARRLKPGSSRIRNKLTAINTGRDPLAISA